MGESIIIRDVPEETRNELSSRAASSGHSLEEYLRDELVKLARGSGATTNKPATEDGKKALLARMEETAKRAGLHLSAEQIVAHIHADRK